MGDAVNLHFRRFEAGNGDNSDSDNPAEAPRSGLPVWAARAAAKSAVDDPGAHLDDDGPDDDPGVPTPAKRPRYIDNES